jgi:orotidine-5'-phosphate decarboxylase
MQNMYDMASSHTDIVAGFICQHGDFCGEKDTRFIYLTPGVHIEDQTDSLGQIYKTPEEAMKNKCDAIIVGRGIYKSSDPGRAAQTYQKRAWNARLTKV